MVSAALHLHQRTDGSYQAVVTLTEDGAGEVRLLLNEESRPMPEVTMAEAWTVAAQMAQDAILAVQPSEGLWSAASGWSHSG